MLLPAPLSVSGTDIAYRAISIRGCCAMFGTDIAVPGGEMRVVRPMTAFRYTPLLPTNLLRDARY
eukprot:3940684-Rhodomonas_salina.1